MYICICVSYISSIRLFYLVHTSDLDWIQQSISILPNSLKTVANFVRVFSFRKKKDFAEICSRKNILTKIAPS
jgi:hypothetical protein